MQPCILHSVTAQGITSIEEAVDCISIMIFYDKKENRINAGMWELYPYLLKPYARLSDDAGFGLGLIGPVSVAVNNFIARDPDGMMN